MVQIKKNTYEVPTEAREEVVQAICDAFLRKCIWSCFHPYDDGIRRATLKVVAHNSGEFYGFVSEPFISSDIVYDIRGCEMREAFKELRKAGYHIFRVYDWNHWYGYKVSEKPFMDNGVEVYEFNDFID